MQQSNITRPNNAIYLISVWLQKIVLWIRFYRVGDTINAKFVNFFGNRQNSQILHCFIRHPVETLPEAQFFVITLEQLAANKIYQFILILP